MRQSKLVNTHTGEYIGTVYGNKVQTPIGTYYLSDSDMKWLLLEAAQRKDFSVMDVRAVGFITNPVTEREKEW